MYTNRSNMNIGRWFGFDTSTGTGRVCASDQPSHWGLWVVPSNWVEVL